MDNSFGDYKDNYIGIKSDLKSCLFVNSLKQTTDCKKEKSDFECFLIDEKFKLAVSKEELKKIEKEFANVEFLISPFSILYKCYTKSKNSKALFVLNQKEFITVAIFKDNLAIFSSHIKKYKDFSIDQFIVNFIKDFYNKSYSFFLENIKIFDTNALNKDDIEKIIENTLLEIEHKSIDLKEELKRFCKESPKFLIELKRRSFLIPFWLKLSTVLIFLILIILDIYLKYQNSKLYSKLAILQNEKILLEKNIKDLSKNIASIESITPIMQDIKATNSLIKSRIENILELVPDSIVLSRAKFFNNSLLLSGFTPTKKDFFILDRSLKSFYQIKDIKFYKLKKGFKFISRYNKKRVKNE